MKSRITLVTLSLLCASLYSPAAYGDQAKENLSAHMWFNIAGAGGNKTALKARDRVAVKMTAADIATAGRMASEWLAKHQKP